MSASISVTAPSRAARRDATSAACVASDSCCCLTISSSVARSLEMGARWCEQGGRPRQQAVACMLHLVGRRRQLPIRSAVHCCLTSSVHCAMMNELGSWERRHTPPALAAPEVAAAAAAVCRLRGPRPADRGKSQSCGGGNAHAGAAHARPGFDLPHLECCHFIAPASLLQPNMVEVTVWQAGLTARGRWVLVHSKAKEWRCFHTCSCWHTPTIRCHQLHPAEPAPPAGAAPWRTPHPALRSLPPWPPPLLLPAPLARPPPQPSQTPASRSVAAAPRQAPPPAGQQLAGRARRCLPGQALLLPPPPRG